MHYLIALLFFIAPVLTRIKHGVPLCTNCRVRYVQYPDWALPNGNSEGNMEPREVYEYSSGRVPQKLQVIRVINHYKQLKTAQSMTEEEKTRWQMRNLLPADYSFIVKIQLKGSSHCSGALVAPLLVLSSSNCFKAPAAKQLDKLTVLLRGGHKLSVSALEQPAELNELTLLVLKQAGEQPLPVQPIDLCSRAPAVGQNATMWMASDDLSYYGRRRTQLISNQACKASYLQDEEVFITPNMLCVRNSLKPEKCATVSGDALLVDNQLCGVNVYGASCQAQAVNADLYSNVYKLGDYISRFIERSSANKA